MSLPAVPDSVRTRQLSRRAVYFALGILLPIASTVITAHTAALRPFPLALHFLSIALIATLGGFGPSLTAVFVTLALRTAQVMNGPHPRSVVQFEIFRIAILLAAALIISVMGRKRRLSEAQLEVTLEELQERSDALVESLNNSKCASWIVDYDSGQSVRWYGGSYPIFGLPFGLVEQFPSIRPLIYKDDQESFEEFRNHMLTEMDPIVREFRTEWPDGQLHWLEARATRVPGSGCCWRGVAFDITERKLAEDVLLKSEKLAAMGRLASTVAHEINNPLESVTNLLYLAATDTSIAPLTREYLSTAETELARLGNITRLTLGFVRSDGGACNVDAAQGVEEVLSIFRHRLQTGGIELERAFEAGVCIQIAPHEFRQVITNLIANATDALRGVHCRIKITIRAEEARKMAVLCIEDNGEGISPANLQRIFEPFFTTKKDVGTGIGLWVSKEMVEKNGGRISAESGDLGGGVKTRFRLEFPLQ